ncbi:hypothetical protein EDD25_2903 [Cryobacterium psychrophilum]|nr:hypothetical protein EDD25_2903 [Cryobacterium psychrophilum]
MQAQNVSLSGSFPPNTREGGCACGAALSDATEILSS